MNKLRKLIIAVFATLMLAGALSAFSAISITTVATVPLLGEGASPYPGVLSSAPDNDSTSLNKRF